MHLAIEEIKIKAKKLHKLARAKNAKAKPEQANLPKLTDCQQHIAKQLGFANFSQARKLFSGQVNKAMATDFGTLFYPSDASRFTNLWFSHYAEAKAVCAAGNAYLLPYKTQFLLVEIPFLQHLGLEQQEIDQLDSVNRDLVHAYPSQLWDRIAQQSIRKGIEVERLVK